MKLIDKAALMVEIEKLQLCTMDEHMNYYSAEAQGEYNALSKLESFLDTLEVKEVDNVWHSANETPKGAGDKEILVQFADSHASVLEIDDWEYLDHQTKWAYLKDLI